MADKREKFVNLANKRVPAAVKAIELVGNLSNTYNYSYTAEDAAAITKVLKDTLTEVQNRFAGRETRESAFKLE